MMTKIDQDQAQALAALVNRIRPDWDTQGIYSAIGKARDMGDAIEVSVAAIRAAADAANRTPAIIALGGDHWTFAISSRSASTVPAAGAPRCPEPSHEHELARNCRACRSEALAAPDSPGHSITLTPEQAATNAAWASRIRLDHAQLASGERDDTEDDA